LKGLSETEAAKTEFLLLSLPPFYSATVENLRTNTGYSYGNIANQLKLYIPARLRGNKRGKKKEDGNSSDSRYSRLNATNEIRLNCTITANVKDSEE
jgi:hypothetical protein